MQRFLPDGRNGDAVFFTIFGIYESNENIKEINVGKSIRKNFYQTAFL
jgi:hypothetical protein